MVAFQSKKAVLEIKLELVMKNLDYINQKYN